MQRRIFAAAISSAALITAIGGALALDSRGGKSAYGDWHSDAPGLMRKISPEDVAAPLATPSTANRSKVVPRPADAQIQTMPGFKGCITGFLEMFCGPSCTDRYDPTPWPVPWS